MSAIRLNTSRLKRRQGTDSGRVAWLEQQHGYDSFFLSVSIELR